MLSDDVRNTGTHDTCCLRWTVKAYEYKTRTGGHYLEGDILERQKFSISHFRKFKVIFQRDHQ